MNSLRIIVRPLNQATTGTVVKLVENDIEFAVQFQSVPLGSWADVPMVWTPAAANARPNIPPNQKPIAT